MGAWKWKLATAASSSTTVVFLWTWLAPQPDRVVVVEPEKPAKVEVQAPAGLVRAYPHLAQAMQQNPVAALVGELQASKGTNHACKVMEALGSLGGDEATAALGQALQDRSSPPVRWCAVTALGKIHTPSAISWLSEFVRDRDPSVRRSVMKSLATRDDDVARGVLVDLTYDEDERIRREALLALVEAGAPGAAEAVLDQIAEAHVDVQVCYVNALREGNSPAAIPALEQLALRGHAMVRPSAIEAWGHIAGDAATVKLAELLQDGSSSVRFAALGALGEIASEAARSALRKATQSDFSEVATEALRKLARMDGDDIRELMLEELDGNEPARVEVAISYFTERGDDSCVPRLVQMPEQAVPWVRIRAMRGLAQLGGSASQQALVKLAGRAGPFRREVLNSLVEVGVDPAQRCQIFERIVREGTTDSGMALSLLAREGGPLPGRVMAKIVDEGGPLASNAASELAKRGDEESIAVLSRAARSGTGKTQLAALYALGQSGNTKAAGILRTALHDTDPEVRRMAYQGMMTLGGEHGERAALDLIRTGKPDERQWALESLRDSRSKTALAEIERLARDEEVGGMAMSILAGTKPKAAAALAREAMQDDDPKRQSAAIDAVSSLPLNDAAQVVESGLATRERSVVLRAIRAARQTPTPGVERALLALLRDDSQDAWVRREAASQLRASTNSASVQSEVDELLGPR